MMKNRAYLCFITLLFFTSFSGKKDPEQLTLTMYQREQIKKSDLGFCHKAKINVLGTAMATDRDSFISVLLIDTSVSWLTVTHDLKKKSFKLVSEPNKLYNPAWKDLPLGKTFTPLTSEEQKVFYNFSKYRLLNKNVYDYIPPDTNTKLDSLIGKVTLLNFWYYGCLPCMAEIPALNNLT